MFRIVLVPLVWSLPPGPLGGMTALRLKEINMFLATTSEGRDWGQACEAVPLMSEEWRAMESQFDMKTGRTWPNLEPSEKAKNTMEYVLRKFWQTFVEDRLVLDDAHTHTHKQNPCSPTLRQWWTKLKDGKKQKSGWDPDS